MKKKLLIISGWAHGIEAIRPMGDALADAFNVQLLTGAQVLNDQAIPVTDYIVTGSMGGLLAMEHLPACCKKLVLIASTAKFCVAEGYPCGTHEKILKRMILQLKRNPDAVLDAFYENVHYPNRRAKHTFESVRESQESLVAGLEYLLHSDVRDQVPQINIPVLILHGEEDRIIPKAAAEWLHEALPQSTLQLFENDGHALPAHHFSAVMTAIRNFLGE